MGCGCGSVGRVVAFDTKVRGLTLVIGKIYIEHLFVYLFIINWIEKTKINLKRPGMAHF